MDVEIQMSDDYNKVGKIQYIMGDSLVNELINTIKDIHLKFPQRLLNNNEPFIICDLGCSLGHTSTKFLRAIFEEVKNINKDLPIEVYLEDTPFNNFEMTLKVVKEALNDFSGITYNALPKSFYESLFPESIVDLFYSSFAMHWLTNCSFPQNQLVYYCDGDKESQPDYDNMESFICNCWKQQMDLRTNELKPGGYLITQVPVINTNSELALKYIQKYRIGKKLFDSVLINNNCSKLIEKVCIQTCNFNEKLLRENVSKNMMINRYTNVETEKQVYSDDLKINAIEIADFLKSYTFGIFRSILLKSINESQVEKILLETENCWKEEFSKLKLDSTIYAAILNISVNK